MRIQHNISALNTHRNLNFNNTNATKALEKLSSGFKINRAGDDAAGLAISEKMRSQIRGLDMASKNAQDSISLIQTAEGAMNEVHAMLQRGRELAVQAANDTNVSDDRDALQKEIAQIKEEIDRIGDTTEFNTQKILKGVGVSIAAGFDREELLNKLNSGWLEAAEKMIHDALGNPTWINQNVDVIFDSDGADGYMAYVKRATPPATLTLGLDEVDFATSSETYQKHTIVHELVHAAMNNNGTIGKSPGWFNEGFAEFVPGGEAYNRIRYLTIDNNTLAKTDIQASNDLSQEHYAASYAAVMYLNNALAAKGNSMGQFITELTTDTFDNVINKLTDFTNENNFIQDFKDNGGAYLDAVENGTAGYDSLAKGLFTGNIDDFFNDHAATVNQGDNLAFNYIINFSKKSTFTLQIGANEGQVMKVDLPNISSSSIGISNVDISKDASKAITNFDNAIKNVSTQRSQLGAYHNRLEHTINNLGIASENLTAAESRIRDTDMAKEMMNFTKQNILMQAAQSMLAQANQQPQGVLQLLG